MTKSIGKKLAGAAGTGATGWTIYDVINNPDALMGLLEAIKAVPFKEGGPARQQYGLGSFVKKFTRPIKKVLKSPLGKAALLGGLGLAANKWGPASGWMSNLSNPFGAAKKNWLRNLFLAKGEDIGGRLSGGKLGLGALGLAAVGTPLWQKMMKTGPYEEIEEETEDWDIQPSSIANLMGEARDYYRNYDPASSRLTYMPGKEYVNPTFYSAKGGLAKLANGGGVAEAQAEQMLKMEYQKYRNQGGTMSYQQFKMTVLKQAQGQGPMAQGQPQMAAKGGRMGYKDPAGLVNYDLDFLRSNLPNLDEVEITDPYISKDYSWLQKLLDHRNPKKSKYIQKKTKNKAEGGLMDMGGMEKDYRQEGGFVAIGGKEKADDVPARLSKNEFVFTADAVRNAGGGDIDQGAQVMENVMKNLEEGGQISEESQGAQGMYNNMKQLETRVA